MSVDFPLGVPANSLRDVILVLGREPAGEGCVRGSPSGVLPAREKKKKNIHTLFIFSLSYFAFVKCLRRRKYIKKEHA